MEFDRTKVYTPFNCDEVKIGSKGYVADTKEVLLSHVQSGVKDDCRTLTRIVNDVSFAFGINNGSLFRYFYLVEEPKEPKKRPCSTEELVEMLKKQGLPMLKSNINNAVCMAGKITEAYVYVYDFGNTTYQELCTEYTLLDGTELWVEE